MLLPKESYLRIFHARENQVRPKSRVREELRHLGKRDFSIDCCTKRVPKNIRHAIAPGVSPDCLEVGDKLVHDLIGFDVIGYLENIQPRRSIASIGWVQQEHPSEELFSALLEDLVREAANDAFEQVAMVIQYDDAPSSQDLANHLREQERALAEAALTKD